MPKRFLTLYGKKIRLKCSTEYVVLANQIVRISHSYHFAYSLTVTTKTSYNPHLLPITTTRPLVYSQIKDMTYCKLTVHIFVDIDCFLNLQQQSLLMVKNNIQSALSTRVFINIKNRDEFTY